MRGFSTKSLIDRNRFTGWKPVPHTVGRSVAVAVLIAAACGCAQPRRMWNPPVEPNDLNDSAFTHYLATVPAVTVDEGSRAVLLLVGSTDQWPTAENRRAELVRRGAFKDDWKLEAEQRLDFGTLAYMLRVLNGVPGGLNEVLLRRAGWGERRYALRTCTHVGILSFHQSYDPVTGGELLSALIASEEFEVRWGRGAGGDGAVSSRSAP